LLVRGGGADPADLIVAAREKDGERDPVEPIGPRQQFLFLGDQAAYVAAEVCIFLLDPLMVGELTSRSTLAGYVLRHDGASGSNVVQTT
jgi:hypothetical protein